MRKKTIALLVALVVLLAAAAPAAAYIRDQITLPVRSFYGKVEYVGKSDLPRFELVAPVYRPILPKFVRPVPPRQNRYVLLVPAEYRTMLGKYSDKGRTVTPKVYVRGALVYVPSLKGMKKAIVVNYVSLARPVPPPRRELPPCLKE